MKQLISILAGYFKKDLPMSDKKSSHAAVEQQDTSVTHSMAAIDTSDWKTTDKVWMASRRSNWLEIEKMLSQHKSKKALGIIKQYYLRGKMPDWRSLKEWSNPERHLDIFCLIWLHPSWDEKVLTPLRDAYIASDLIVEGDIGSGFEIFFGSINPSCRNYESEDEINRILTTGSNEIIFKVLMGDLSNSVIEIQGYTPRDPIVLNNLPNRVYKIPKSSIGTICTMAKWLCIKTMFPINEDMLFQYDQPLEWWYQSCETEEGYFEKPRNRGSQKYFEKALYCIYHFDTAKEGNSCRTHFVQKVRKILDERKFIREFEMIWARVKSGEIQIENAFEP
jgi:hypothetical protein